MHGNLIGIVAAHDEQVVPTNPDYQLFFDALRLENRRTEVVEARLAAGNLKPYGALLIGAPHAVLGPAELASVRDWVALGGHLLVLACAGGDAAPGGLPHSRCNLGSLLEDVRFEDDALGIDQGVLRGEPFATRVPVDTAPLTGQPGRICYDTGCTLSFPALAPVLELAAPREAATISGMRLRGGQVSAADPYPRRTRNALFVHYRSGQGSITVLGAAGAFSNEAIIQEQTLAFASWLFLTWLPALAPDEVARRQQGPQRHRLLHGYPMAPLMHPAGQDPLDGLEDGIAIGDRRGLMVGVLPHPFCNPKVKGCGYCTFPQEMFSPAAAARTTGLVAEEIRRFAQARPYFRGRKVAALYFGGGTANLGRPEPFRTLCRTLAESFDLAGAEITLEGVPAYHDLDHGTRLADLIPETFPDARVRLSMGIQTFDPLQLQRMGRTSFGDEATLQRVARRSREAGFTVSADLLINLPGQTREQMRSDLRRIIDSGVEHICLYHLVLFDGIDTEWSRDPELLNGLPANAEACDNWIALRELLLAEGFGQRTLTNFERTGAANPFEYELKVFEPERNDWLGFGPSAISLVCDRHFDRALKLVNPEHSADYNAAIERGGRPYDRWYAYSPQDLRILYATRKIAALGIRRDKYRAEFGTDLLADFPREIEALAQAGLVTAGADRVEPTVRGMFYADTVAGMFAWRQVARSRAERLGLGRSPGRDQVYYGVANEAGPRHMG